jgi:hypothetical protein
VVYDDHHTDLSVLTFCTRFEFGKALRSFFVDDEHAGPDE